MVTKHVLTCLPDKTVAKKCTSARQLELKKRRGLKLNAKIQQK